MYFRARFMMLQRIQCSGVDCLLNVCKRWSSSSYFVRKTRALDALKTDDSTYHEELKRGQFLVFVNQQAFLRSAGPYSWSALWIQYPELKFILDTLDLYLDPNATALVGNSPLQTESNDVEGEWIPNIALGLRCADHRRVMETFQRELGGHFIDPRLAIIGSHATQNQEVIAKAQTLLRWGGSYKFCPSCGSKLNMKGSKASATCSSCAKPYYPPCSPVSICLVRNEANSHLLLISLPRSRAKAYTAVAGFSEPGETLEDTTRREVAEEVGVEVSDISYYGYSQPWPFPQGSMMCSFIATAVMSPGDVDFSRDELLDAAWFSREEIAAAFERMERNPSLNLEKESSEDQEKKLVFIPPHGTLAHTMIVRWLKDGP